MDFLLQITWSVIASICFAIGFRAPRRYFILTVAVGLVSSLMYRSLLAHQTQVFSAAVTAFTIGAISQTLARLTHCPSQAFLIPGVIFLVPGVQVFSALEKIRTQTNPDFTIDIYKAIAVSCSISFAVLLANWLIPSHKEL